mmetsp:Transcript_35062/g.89696  ORF Transcript_35062/g.89696 Transcript_35062/m.89696 type:complete len:159 (-) Transcript_35062:501-977(-)
MYYHGICSGGTDDGWCNEHCRERRTRAGHQTPPAVEDMVEEPEDGEAIEQDVNGDNGPEAEAGAMQVATGHPRTPLAAAKRRFEDMDPKAAEEDGIPLATTPFRQSMLRGCAVAQAKQARVMETTVASKYGPAPQVGDPVQIAVPGVHRGRLMPQPAH